jgi:uncharacterized protein (DUF58 family)
MISNSDYRKYLDPSVIARLSGLELKARLVVEGFMTGLHKSPYHGFSVEFAEHRQYMPGDDLRHLDWKILARSERYYIKQYEEETNLKSYILLDISRSMNYSSASANISSRGFIDKIFKKESKQNGKSRGLSKLEYSSYLAAALSYMMLKQNDAISLTTYDTAVRSYVPPRSTNTNLKMILKDIEAINPENKTGTAKCLNEIASKINRRGLVIVISDLFDDPKEVINALKHFRYKMNDVVVFQVLDPVEMNFLDGNPVTLVDLETREELFSQPIAIQKAYREAMKDFIENYKKEFRNNRIDYVLLSTDTPYDKALLGYLTKRRKVM